MASYRPVMRDYKPTLAKPQPRGRWLLWFVAGLGLPLITVAVMLPDPGINPFSSDPETVSSPAAESDTPPPLNPTSEISMYVAAPEPEPEGRRIELIVGRGDSLDRLFRKNDLSSADLALIMREDLARKHLRLVKPGDEIVIWRQDNQIAELRREIDFSKSLQVRRTSDGFDAGLVEHDIVAQHIEARGTINSSLFLAAVEAGVTERTIMNLAGIFAWDIDFVLDIREGDQFHVIVEELWRHGQRVAEGDILAAEFVNQGETFQAIRYRDPDGKVSYFSPDGRNMRKAFLRAPLSFSRVSSNFNPNRRHPVLNTIRAHKGVDYAAPRGTAVKAAGDGKVIFRGGKGGYGNTVILQHGGNITTLYAHMSNFNRKARNGSRVSQGQTIGYVGQSGLATGPHLHYEYRKNGVHKNPRTVNLPDASPINPAFKEDFLRVAQPLISVLDDKAVEINDLTTARNTR
ncbi:MAG: M23 family metallopeptidase [Gammaproteobacteria bacterium]|nr:M23 family metallopeptidase [Gammaproteobacteria bacterium]